MVSTRNSPNAGNSSSKESSSKRMARCVWGLTEEIRDAPLPPPYPPSSPGSSGSSTCDDSPPNSPPNSPGSHVSSSGNDGGGWIYWTIPWPWSNPPVDSLNVESFFLCTSAGPKPVLPPPPPVLDSKKLKIPTASINFSDHKASKRAYKRLKKKTIGLKDGY